LVWREAGDCQAHLRQRQARLRFHRRIAAGKIGQRQEIHRRRLTPPVPEPIDPDSLDDAVHPVHQPRPRLVLVPPGQRPLAGGLNEIVSLVDGAGKAEGKAPQLRQRRHQFPIERRIQHPRTFSSAALPEAGREHIATHYA
jgi:hypothetical protein